MGSYNRWTTEDMEGWLAQKSSLFDEIKVILAILCGVETRSNPGDMMFI